MEESSIIKEPQPKKEAKAPQQSSKGFSQPKIQN
jgi:hypothetical protein